MELTECRLPGHIHNSCYDVNKLYGKTPLFLDLFKLEAELCELFIDRIDSILNDQILRSL